MRAATVRSSSSSVRAAASARAQGQRRYVEPALPTSTINGEVQLAAGGIQRLANGRLACCRYQKCVGFAITPHQMRVQRPCLICGRQPSDPHHLRFAQPRALGRKVSDEFIVPLCRAHHREVHRSSDEVGWWKQAGLDPLGFAQKLWRDSHPLQPRSPVLCSANKRRWRTGAFVPQTRKPWARDMIPRFLVVFPVHFHALLGHA